MRNTHAAYMEITVPREDGTHVETATSSEFVNEESAVSWVERNRACFEAVGVHVTLTRVEPMPEPESITRAEQDGRYFFTAQEGDYGRVLFVAGEDVVKDDFDTAGAQRARDMFLAEFPNAVLLSYSDESHEEDGTAVGQAWLLVLIALESATGSLADGDDEGMRSADDGDLIAWADDLEARCGFDVAALRTAMSNYMGLRAQFGG